MGELNLPEQFGRKAKAMLLGVEQGRAAHKSGNIKASGAPLEELVRSLLSESLPSTIKVASGYFYGASSQCSAEVDVLIYEEQEAFRLDPAPQEQHYVPYTSVSIVGQIKNSARDLPGAIVQVQKSLRAWNEMQQALPGSSATTGKPPQGRPLTFVVCGECLDEHFQKLSTTLEKMGEPFVDYILFLDRGLIVAGNCDLLIYDSPSIDFSEYTNANALHLCKPDGAPDQPQGVALLWIYFALVSKLSCDQGHNLRYHAFCRQISALYPLRPTQKLL